ncbi:hypothetical protein M8J77_015206 [Diaphorina citri]|nr:hypothetical protein M8J77_015206 [Diaphorina citri]
MVKKQKCKRIVCEFSKSPRKNNDPLRTYLLEVSSSGTLCEITTNQHNREKRSKSNFKVRKKSTPSSDTLVIKNKKTPQRTWSYKLRGNKTKSVDREKQKRAKKSAEPLTKEWDMLLDEMLVEPSKNTVQKSKRKTHRSKTKCRVKHFENKKKNNPSNKTSENEKDTVIKSSSHGNHLNKQFQSENKTNDTVEKKDSQRSQANKTSENSEAKKTQNKSCNKVRFNLEPSKTLEERNKGDSAETSQPKYKASDRIKLLVHEVQLNDKDEIIKLPPLQLLKDNRIGVLVLGPTKAIQNPHNPSLSHSEPQKNTSAAPVKTVISLDHLIALDETDLPDSKKSLESKEFEQIAQQLKSKWGKSIQFENYSPDDTDQNQPLAEEPKHITISDVNWHNALKYCGGKANELSASHSKGNIKMKRYADKFRDPAAKILSELKELQNEFQDVSRTLTEANSSDKDVETPEPRECYIPPEHPQYSNEGEPRYYFPALIPPPPPPTSFTTTYDTQGSKVTKRNLKLFDPQKLLNINESKFENAPESYSSQRNNSPRFNEKQENMYVVQQMQNSFEQRETQYPARSEEEAKSPVVSPRWRNMKQLENLQKVETPLDAQSTQNPKSSNDIKDSPSFNTTLPGSLVVKQSQGSSESPKSAWYKFTPTKSLKRVEHPKTNGTLKKQKSQTNQIQIEQNLRTTSAQTPQESNVHKSNSPHIPNKKFDAWPYFRSGKQKSYLSNNRNSNSPPKQQLQNGDTLRKHRLTNLSELSYSSTSFNRNTSSFDFDEKNLNEKSHVSKAMQFSQPSKNDFIALTPQQSFVIERMHSSSLNLRPHSSLEWRYSSDGFPINSELQDVGDHNKETSPQIEHLLENVKNIGQQYYQMSSKTMIPVLRQVQNQLICRFYNLRQYLNQSLQNYVDCYEKSLNSQEVDSQRSHKSYDRLRTPKDSEDHAATPATARYVIVTDAIVTCFNVGSAIHEDADNSRTYKESSVELQLRKRNIHMMRGVKTRGMSGGQNSMRDKIGY